MHNEQPTSVTQPTTNKKSVPKQPRLCMMEMSKLRQDEDNARKSYDGIDTLAESIRRDGVLQPLLVRPEGDDGMHLILAGHRRYRAVQKTELTQVPVYVKDVDDEDKVAVQLIENIQRSDLSSIEIARALKKLLETEPAGDDRLERAGARVGKTANWVSRHLGLLKLDLLVIEAISRNRLGISQAAEVARLARADKRTQALELAAAMKNGQVKRADARSQQAAAPVAPARVIEKRGEGFALRLTITSMPEDKANVLVAEIERSIARVGGAQ